MMHFDFRNIVCYIIIITLLFRIFRNNKGVAMPGKLISPSPTVFGGLLKSARNGIGYTLKEVSESLGLAISTISEIEAGKRRVSMVELYKFSRLYQRPIDFFFDQQESNKSFMALYRVADEASIEKKIFVDFHELCRDYKSLQQLMKTPVTSGVPDYSAVQLDNYEKAETLAELERSQLGLNGQPIKDIYDLLENKRGIKIFHLPEDTGNFSGAFTCDESLGACFLINSKHSLRRRTFTVAHEYAHCLAHRNQLAHVDTYQNFTTRNPRERFANAFAAAFLMPKNTINELLNQLSPDLSGSVLPETLLRMAIYFGVSYDAMAWRLVSLRKLLRPQCEFLVDEQTKSTAIAKFFGYNSDDNSKPEIVPGNYKYLAYTAYKKRLISFEKLAELLRKNFYELKQEISDSNTEGDE